MIVKGQIFWQFTLVDLIFWSKRQRVDSYLGQIPSAVQGFLYASLPRIWLHQQIMLIPFAKLSLLAGESPGILLREIRKRNHHQMGDSSLPQRRIHGWDYKLWWKNCWNICWNTVFAPARWTVDTTVELQSYHLDLSSRSETSKNMAVTVPCCACSPGQFSNKLGFPTWSVRPRRDPTVCR